MVAQRIVIGADFSMPADAAAVWVASRFSPEAELVLVYVIDEPAPTAFAPTAVIASALEHARREAGAGLRNLGEELRSRKMRTFVRFGRAHDQLVTTAVETGADLIAIGPHSDERRRWKLLGTTAERVVRTAPCSVLVVANPRDSIPRRILVGVDDAPITTHVLDYARTLAIRFEASVTLLHVLDRGVAAQLVTVGAASMPGAAQPPVRSELIGAGTEWLKTLIPASLQDVAAQALVVEGKPAEAIVSSAVETNADLIVLGRSGRGRIQQALLGSTVSGVLHGAPCPVLIVSEAGDPR